MTHVLNLCRDLKGDKALHMSEPVTRVLSLYRDLCKKQTAMHAAMQRGALLRAAEAAEEQRARDVATVEAQWRRNLELAEARHRSQLDQHLTQLAEGQSAAQRHRLHVEAERLAALGQVWELEQHLADAKAQAELLQLELQEALGRVGALDKRMSDARVAQARAVKAEKSAKAANKQLRRALEKSGVLSKGAGLRASSKGHMMCLAHRILKHVAVPPTVHSCTSTRRPVPACTSSSKS
jgi:chromosome segregation ATPase